MRRITVIIFLLVGVPSYGQVSNTTDRCVPNPEYPKVAKRFETKCAQLDPRHIENLRALIISYQEKGANKGAMGREGRKWCKEQRLSDEYRSCVPAMVNLLTTPEYMIEPEPAAELSFKAKVFLMQWKAARQTKIQSVQKEYERVAKRMSTNKWSRIRGRKLQKQLQAFETNDPPFMLVLSLERMFIGAMGFPLDMRIYQILGQDEALMTLDGLVVIVKGVSMNGRIDGQGLSSFQGANGGFEVTGTETYPTTTGGTNTTFVLEPLPLDIFLSAMDSWEKSQKPQVQVAISCCPKASE
jgi:hypothetical protein